MKCINLSSSQAKVSCYFVELYLDNIRDLFFAMDRPRDTPPKLDIKLDANKMVFLKNVVIKVRRKLQATYQTNHSTLCFLGWLSMSRWRVLRKVPYVT